MSFLAPSKSILQQYKQTGNTEQYTERFKAEILNGAHFGGTKWHLEQVGRGRDVALCCYEKPGDFCHRHLVAEWLRKNGIECEEWRPR